MMKISFGICIVVVLLSTVISDGAQVAKRTATDFFFRKKCMDELGCFSNGPPFFNLLERPLSLLPDDRDQIGTKFILYTTTSPDIPVYFTNKNLTFTTIYHTDFNPKLRTKFVIPGFMSKIAKSWKKPLKDALLNTESCNVFMVDWQGGDGPLYEQAVSNTRVVGAEIAQFIQTLQETMKIIPEDVHIIGHSLGSHIAGYAGKRVKNLGRITGMDPAGPYFTKVDPAVRLDKNDALFVDAIHTNAAPSRFTGFGLIESIGHFDFYPNGGHIQPGCEDTGHAILSFLEHPTLDFSGLEGLMCSHSRAIELFTASLTSACEIKGMPCDSWNKFIRNQCGSCKSEEDACVVMGMHADRFANRINKDKSLVFYLNTTDTTPFCKE